MNILFEKLQQCLYTVTPDYRRFVDEIRECQKNLEGLDFVCSYGILRLGMALHSWQEKGKATADVAVLLRQVIRSHKQRLMLSRVLWEQLVQGNVLNDLRPIETEKTELLQITADDWHPSWLVGAEHIDFLQKRRKDQVATGDGLLYAMTDGLFSQYQSQAQQSAVHACLFTEPGSTLLVMLPTGSGKSMVAQLPAWLDAQNCSGTTLVVVPTVALALDQEQKVVRYFEKNTLSPDYLPHSWTAQTPPEIREQILQGIRYGTLPILYVSPEALMQSSLYTACLEAAGRGTINYLVIDEAHLVESWGAGFRTDFQFLAAYRTQMLSRSGGRLRTLLLSATVSLSCIRLLKQLFDGNNQFYKIAANRLRPEPAYWFTFAQHAHTRQRRVLEALYHLPRPLILYVATIKDATNWEMLLHSHNFRRVATFTGDTEDDERLRLITAWNHSEIDMMIATSAFGLGVDKSDVRTIIHACLPESVERFYQEVGRAGRDGFSSISLVCTTVDDYQLARDMTSKARITIEKATERWEGMRKSAVYPNKERHDIVLVDTDVPPDESPDMRRSKANRRWNEHTLLLMQRARLIQVTNTREDIAGSWTIANDISSHMQTGLLQLQLLNPTITAYPRNIQFQQKMEEVRNQEREEVDTNLRKVEWIVREYTSKQPRTCLANSLAELYPECALACGGCPFCRMHNIAPYEQQLPLEIDMEPGSPRSSYLHEELRLLMGLKATMNVSWESVNDSSSVLTQFKLLLTDLVQAGMQQLLLPAALLGEQIWVCDLIRDIAKYKPVPHRILSDQEVIEGIPLYPVPTVILYPTDDSEADAFHRRIRLIIRQWNKQRVPVIYIVRRSLFLASEAGYFMDRIDGKTETMHRLQSILAQWQELVLF